jgi:hypothetical protein
MPQIRRLTLCAHPREVIDFNEVTVSLRATDRSDAISYKDKDCVVAHAPRNDSPYSELKAIALGGDIRRRKQTS